MNVSTERMTLRVPSWPPVLDRLAVPALAILGAAYGILGWLGRAPLPGDAAVYWLNTPGDYAVGMYGYPPVLSQILGPLKAIDAPGVFVVAWETLCFASVGYALGRFAIPALIFLPLALVFPIFDPLVAPVVAAMLGNVTMSMTAAIVAAMRHDAAGWLAVPLLTKITPGIGILWFALRREWRLFALGLSVTAAIVAVSFALDPAAWFAYGDFVLTNAGAQEFGPPIVGPPLWLRAAVAILLLVWGARGDRRWVVPIAAGLVVVGLYGAGSITAIAAGALGLLGARSPRPTR